MSMSRKYTIKVVIVIVLWYLTSSLNNVIGKRLLTEFEYPLTLTFVQLLSISIYMEPILRYRKSEKIPKSYYLKIVIPLAIGKFIASVFSHVSIWRVPVSYAHTVKATMPLFTVVLGRILLNERHSTRIYLSLIPIILGVAIASLTEIRFDVFGLIAALLATCGFSLQNIFSKKVLKETGVHHFQLLATLGRLAFIMFLPIWMFVDLAHISRRSWSSTTYILLFIDGLLNFLQNLLAFTVLSLVTPLTYAVVNASKRIAIITISILLLKNPITWTNIVGMTLAVSGVFLYNRVKSSEKLIPKTVQEINFNYINI